MATFNRLVFAGKATEEYFPDVQDPRMFVGQQLNAFFQQHAEHKAAIPQELHAPLATYFKVCLCHLFLLVLTGSLLRAPQTSRGGDTDTQTDTDTETQTDTDTETQTHTKPSPLSPSTHRWQESRLAEKETKERKKKKERKRKGKTRKKQTTDGFSSWH